MRFLKGVAVSRRREFLRRKSWDSRILQPNGQQFSNEGMYLSVKYAKKAVQVMISIILMIFILFPVLWLLLSSVKLPLDLFSNPPKIWPSEWTIKYYIQLLKEKSFTSAMLNSFIVSGFTTAISLSIGSLGAYAFARFQFPRKNAFF